MGLNEGDMNSDSCSTNWVILDPLLSQYNILQRTGIKIKQDILKGKYSRGAVTLKEMFFFILLPFLHELRRGALLVQS